jgi:hypothetical protein
MYFSIWLNFLEAFFPMKTSDRIQHATCIILENMLLLCTTADAQNLRIFSSILKIDYQSYNRIRPNKNKF